MAFTADGSRICNSSRAALAAIDANFTMAAKADKIIYAAGVSTTVRMRANDTTQGASRFFFRRVGAAGFTEITNLTEVKITQAAGDTVLVDNTAVTAANKRTNATPIAVVAARETEAVATSFDNLSAQVSGGRTTEMQIALDFGAGLDNQQYEFAVDWTDEDGVPGRVTYLAKVSTPAGGTTFSQTLAAVSAGIVVLSSLKTLVRLVTATAVGVPALTRAATYLRSLPAIAVSVSGLAKGIFVALSATAIGTAVLSAANLFTRALAAVTAGLASLSTTKISVLALAATAVGIAAFTKIVTFVNTLAAVAAEIGALSKGRFLTLAATAVGVPAAVKGMFKTLAATVTGVPTLAATPLSSVSVAAVSVGIAALAKVVAFVSVLAAVATGIGVLSRAVIYARVLAAITVGLTVLDAVKQGGQAITEKMSALCHERVRLFRARLSAEVSRLWGGGE